MLTMRLSSVMTPCGGIRDNLLTHVEVMLHSIDDRNKQMGARVKTPIELSEPLNETDLLLVNDFDARRQHDDEQDNNHQTGDELGHEYSCDTCGAGQAPASPSSCQIKATRL